MGSSHRVLGVRGWVALGLLALGVLVGSMVVRHEGNEAVADRIPPSRVPSLADPLETYDPVKAGESLPDDFRTVLRRDVIAPVYDPEFVPAASVDWGPETLVVGVAMDGEAKAYPVNYMNVHEMVNDHIAGTPILVSW